jgi:ABC-type bacteriocin/lantibiotic exporter with double-glycine peptidase domain
MIMFYISWQLTLVTLGGIFPIIIVGVVFGNLMRKITKEKQEKIADLGKIAQEDIANIRTVKAFACEKQEMDKFRKLNKEAYDIGMKGAVYAGLFTFFIIAVLYTSEAALIYYGAYLIEHNELTIGSLSAFLLYMIQLIFNFTFLSMTIASFFQVIGASDKIIELMLFIPTVESSGGKMILNP